MVFRSALFMHFVVKSHDHHETMNREFSALPKVATASAFLFNLHRFKPNLAGLNMSN